MPTKIFVDPDVSRAATSTGHLPPRELVSSLTRQAYELFKDVEEGKVASYIPALARVSPELFAICLAGVNGSTHSIGDVAYEFSIQSISKPFVFALVCEALGADEAREKLGVNNTGLPFNSVMAIELNESRTMNPMVNAGAIAASSLVPGSTAQEKWEFIREGLSSSAGRSLSLDAEVYGGLAVFAPRLDAAGNSVKGQRVSRFLSEALGLNLFASRPAV